MDVLYRGVEGGHGGLWGDCVVMESTACTAHKHFCVPEIQLINFHACCTRGCIRIEDYFVSPSVLTVGNIDNKTITVL